MYTVKMFPEVIQEGCGYRLHDCLGSEQLASWDGRILMKLAGENLEAQIPKSVPGFALSINNEHATVTPLNPDRVKLYVVDEKKENIDPDLIRYMGELFKQQSILLVHSESRAIRKFKENFAKIF